MYRATLNNRLWAHFSRRFYDVGSSITRNTFDLNSDISYGLQIRSQVPQCFTLGYAIKKGHLDGCGPDIQPDKSYLKSMCHQSEDLPFRAAESAIKDTGARDDRRVRSLYPLSWARSQILCLPRIQRSNLTNLFLSEIQTRRSVK